MKRFWPVAALIVGLPMLIAAVTLNTNQPWSAGFSANGHSGDWTGAEELVAAPGAGKYLVINKVLISADAECAVSIGGGESTNTLTTRVFGPIYMAANTSFETRFDPPIRLADNTALVADADTAATATIQVEGIVVP